MKTTDMRAKARAIFGPAIAEPMPKQPNGAKALQQRANARPIPTYKVGGPVKKPMPTPADLAAAKAQNELIKEMMANGGAKTSSDAKRYIARMQEVDRKAEEIKARSPHNAYGTMEARDKVLRKVQNDIEARDRADEDAVKRKPVGVDFIYGEPATYRKMSKMEKMAYDDQAKRSGYNEEGSFGRKHLVSGVKKTEVFPDARKRGIKPADVMKNGGKVQTSSDTARKLATEMGGMRKGGKVKPVELDMSSLEEMSRSKPSFDTTRLMDRGAEARNLNAVREREIKDAEKKMSFSEKFAKEREKQGPDGVFTWRGKHYNTKMAGETSKAAPPRAAAAPAPVRAAAPPARAAAPPPPPPPRATAPAPRGGPPAASAGMPAPRGGPPAASANPTDQALNALADQIMKQRTGSFLQGQLTRAEALEEARKQNSKRKMLLNNDESAVDAALLRQMQGQGPIANRSRPPMAFKKGGKVKEAKPKDGLAVIIAIGNPKKPAKKMGGGPMDYAHGGAPHKKMAGGPMAYAEGGRPVKKMAGGMMDYAEGGKPVKKMNGGAMAGGSRDMEASKVTRAMAMGGDPMNYMGGGTPMGYAAGGAGKMRKGQAPIKKAQGGAAKVRKGMMTPEGNIIDAMNKMRGK